MACHCSPVLVASPPCHLLHLACTPSQCVASSLRQLVFFPFTLI
ncbi:hypothetical protein E2C01_067370 [Portunus trituberculatus]|uniref:Uncharacterized protein n=1 Tax=Portunus trituberculatus TaxID=210409 RepID=A0A5B7HNX5_PORTR|nr:hypothetical protein [Portunus trituberculatus]